jgi:ketosteroid isomerase-like protein
MSRQTGWLAAVLLAGSISASAQQPDVSALAEQVRATERAFAKTMADRDHAAFASFLSEEAVFLGRTVLRGKAQVAAGWKAYYEAPQAPFSWEPDRVEVLASATLAVSTGPVYDPAGKRVGTFVSTWRREPDGTWKIVLDSGCPPCPPDRP